MNVHEAIRARHSVRDFRSTPVPEESLARVLEAARLAPSSSNRQEWRFIVVRDEDRRRRLAVAANNQMFIAVAPVIIATVATEPDSIMTCGLPRYAVDCTIAIDHVTIAAVEEGLGTCWIGAFSQEKVRDILGVGPDCMVVTIMPLGYPTSDAVPAKSRKRLQDIVRYETYTP
ncbi:MAG: nitroreductase family protein [Dehalococcoidia bacterium]|jgi:nitroreductase|nr:nitroreductase family protein [Dehalococcoidia bacterium]